MEKKWIIFALLLIGSIGALIISQPAKIKIDLSQVDKNSIINPGTQNGEIADHIMGDPKAKAVMIVYGDYQCPACAQHNQELTQLAQKFSKNLAIIFRHFPLPGHTSAIAAAAVAEAAGQQGKFWEMHRLLFQNYLVWGSDVTKRDDIFKTYAKQLGLDEARFEQDLKSPKIKQKINFDTALGKAHQLQETPTIILNGDKISTEIWSDAAKFEELIKTKLVVK